MSILTKKSHVVVKWLMEHATTVHQGRDAAAVCLGLRLGAGERSRIRKMLASLHKRDYISRALTGANVQHLYYVTADQKTKLLKLVGATPTTALPFTQVDPPTTNPADLTADYRPSSHCVDDAEQSVGEYP